MYALVRAGGAGDARAARARAHTAAKYSCARLRVARAWRWGAGRGVAGEAQGGPGERPAAAAADHRLRAGGLRTQRGERWTDVQTARQTDRYRQTQADTSRQAGRQAEKRMAGGKPKAPSRPVGDPARAPQVWLEYVFGICAPDRRNGKRGNRCAEPQAPAASLRPRRPARAFRKRPGEWAWTRRLSSPS